MKRRWRKRHSRGPAEVNITAFMNLMVILVPFLLITAVFSRITILELNLPAPAAQKQPAGYPICTGSYCAMPQSRSVIADAA